MLKDSQLDLCGRVDFARTAPLLGRDEAFSFACAGCGDCCRGREDIVLSGFDLWRIAARLRLPPQTVARAFCRASIGPVSHLPVLRLAPVKEERNNCPFLTEEPLRHPRRRAAGLRPLPAGAGDQPGRGGALLFAAHRLRRERVFAARGGGLSGPLRRALPGKRPTSAGHRPAWSWRTWWSRWTPPSSRRCAAGCRRSSGRPSISGSTTGRPTCRSWKQTSSGWTKQLQKLTEYQQRRNTYRKK